MPVGNSAGTSLPVGWFPAKSPLSLTGSAAGQYFHGFNLGAVAFEL